MYPKVYENNIYVYYKKFLKKNKYNDIVNNKNFRNKMNIINYGFYKTFKINNSHIKTYLLFIKILDKNINNEDIMVLIDKTFLYLLDIQKLLMKQI